MTDTQSVIQSAKAKWNAQADAMNQWDELDCDEKLELVVREAVSGPPIVAWMTEEGTEGGTPISERVITAVTKSRMPLAAQVPYTVALVRASSLAAKEEPAS